MTERSDVLVVGAGPVGLDVATRLALSGRSVRVLERRLEPTRHSRSIGIHPPALEALAEIGVAERLVAAGLPVRRGTAFDGRRPIGSLSFDRCPPPYRFVLAIPQWATEGILEERLAEVAPGALERGVDVTGLTQDAGSVRVTSSDGGTFEATWLVAADGKHSAVRGLVGIGFPGRTYDDPYMMGDFDDSTPFGPTAAIFLGPAGLVESFPLPGRRRRWVVRVPAAVERPAARDVTRAVEERTGYTIDPAGVSMTSAFGVERRLATTMAVGRVLLAGDAAHVVSPIGGQGMNLGWLDAREAARAILSVRGSAGHDTPFAAYSDRRRLAADRAAARAEFNMGFGRPSTMHAVRALAVRVMLSPGFRDAFARRFTMRGL